MTNLHRFFFWITGLTMGLCLSCATRESDDTMAQTIELAAYATAKRTLTANPSPERRSDFQSTVDVLWVLLSDWTPQPPSREQVFHALSLSGVSEMQCTTGSLQIRPQLLLYEISTHKLRKIQDKDLPMVCKQVSDGLTRFLSINNER